MPEQSPVDSKQDSNKVAPPSISLPKGGGPIPMQGSYTFEPSGDGTRVTFLLTGEPGGFFKLAEPVMSNASVPAERRGSAAIFKDNGFWRATTLRRGRTPVRGNGMAIEAAYITVNDRRIFCDTEARGSQRASA